MRVMLIAAILLASTVDVANGLRNLAQMHEIAAMLELRALMGLDVPPDLPPDPWGTPYRIENGMLVSAGSDKKFEDVPEEGQFTGTGGDIVFLDGRLVRSNRNWLYARVTGATDSAAALEELRTAELGAMRMHDPTMQRLTLVVEAAISEKGAVEDVLLLKSLAPDLDSAAMNAVRKWTFEPATADGKPIPVLFNLTVNFKLR